MKIKPISLTQVKPVNKNLPKPAKSINQVCGVDLSCEDKGFYKIGNKVVDIIFPR